MRSATIQSSAVFLKSTSQILGHLPFRRSQVFLTFRRILRPFHTTYLRPIGGRIQAYVGY